MKGSLHPGLGVHVDVAPTIDEEGGSGSNTRIDVGVAEEGEGSSECLFTWPSLRETQTTVHEEDDAPKEEI